VTPNPSTIALDLVRRFRRQRPLRAGSLIVTIFGDSIMPRGGAVALGSLIRLAIPFGINERLVRTATARLAQEGWVKARRVGKLSEYELSNDGRDRFAEATERIYGEPGANWSGRWTLMLLPTIPAAERHRLRKELVWHGFGEICNGVFAHPEVPAPGLDVQFRGSYLPAGTLIFDAALANDQGPAGLVDLGWDLADLAKRYHRFVQRFEHADTALRNHSVDPLTGFVLRTLLIHEYRRLHLRDPLLPRRLLPSKWPGIRAAELCRDIYGNVFAASEAYLSQAAAQLDGPLPPPDRSVMKRFGGITEPAGAPRDS
jgi:phenylacetic acid degradation operon negative regulatory protein